MKESLHFAGLPRHTPAQCNSADEDSLVLHLELARQRIAKAHEFLSAEAFESFMLEHSGGAITARRALEALGRWNDAYAALHEAIER
jgi:hypothetical protein